MQLDLCSLDIHSFLVMFIILPNNMFDEVVLVYCVYMYMYMHVYV